MYNTNPLAFDEETRREEHASNTVDHLVDKRGVQSTALMWTACNGDTAAVQDLIAQGDTVDIATKNGLTAIMFAAHNGHSETVAELIRCGASLERRDAKGKTALMFAEQSHRAQTVKVIQEHLQRGVTPTSVNIPQPNCIDHLVDKRGVQRTALMWAACNGDTAAVQDLIAQGATVDIATKNGLTAIMFAAHNGHSETVAELIRCGASLERRDAKGKTALMFAEQSHRAQTVKVIQDHMSGRPRSVVNRENLQHEENTDIYNLAKTTLFSATMIGRIDIMNQIFACHKEYIDATDAHGKTVLMLAAEAGHHDTIQELLYTHGANLDAVDDDGKSALDYAMQNNHIQVVELMENFCNMNTAPIIEEEDSATECQICLCNKPNIAFIPCGHGTCDACCQNLMSSKDKICHICRKPVEKTLKLYL